MASLSRQRRNTAKPLLPGADGFMHGTFWLLVPLALLSVFGATLAGRWCLGLFLSVSAGGLLAGCWWSLAGRFAGVWSTLGPLVAPLGRPALPSASVRGLGGCRACVPWRQPRCRRSRPRLSVRLRRIGRLPSSWVFDVWCLLGCFPSSCRLSEGAKATSPAGFSPGLLAVSTAISYILPGS